MINLISPEQKRDIRAARVNVILVKYCTLLLLLAALIGLIYGVGFWLVGQDKNAVGEKLLSQSDQSKAYAAVEKEADTFRQNLTIAESILSNETSYSTFLTTLAGDMPSGTLLTNLSIGTSVTAQKGMKIDARTSSYAKVLELKNSLEQSVLFENVNIVNTTRPDNITSLTGLEARYPYEASFNVKLSAKKVTTGATP
jgi:Tfp pilus assembly protein PilN